MVGTVVPGRHVTRRNALVGVLDKASEFAERAVHEWTGKVFQDDAGAAPGGPVPADGPHRAGEGAQAQEVRRHRLEPYTDEQIAEIDAQYAAEDRRGAEPRWWEDVEEGDEFGPMVKGPLTVTDMVCWHVGMGMGLYGVAPLRLGVQNRQRIPRFFHRDDLNVPDVMQRVHWDPEFARRSGNPTTYDYGRMRETWLIHLCTDWMGDDAWLWKLECEFRKFNYVGDTQWIGGTVVRKHLADGDRPAVDLELVGPQPARRGHHAGHGHDPAAAPRARRRSDCPTRRAAPPTSPARWPPSPKGSPADDRPPWA